MKTKLFSILTVCFIVTSVFSQSNLNNYKYIIVPNKFDFLKEKDQYQLNSLAKFLFEKYGFKTLIEGENYPEDLLVNRCLGLKSDVFKESGMFKTKLSIELKDCFDKVVYKSKLGESREKEFAKSYNLALRDAFNSFKDLNYNYQPSDAITTLATQKAEIKNEVSKEIEQLKQEIQNLKKEKTEVVKTEPEVVVEESPTASVVPAVIRVKEEVETVKAIAVKETSNVLYAQEIINGFQLIDSTPKVVYKIKNTGLDNVFLVEGKSAILYKKGAHWILEYYLNNTLKQDTLNIKF